MENDNIVSGGDSLDMPMSVYTDTRVMYGSSAMLTDDVGEDYMLSDYFVNYFQGYLANMPETDYIAFALNSEHCFLVYDLKLENGAVVNGNYPCVQIYRDSLNQDTYNVAETTYSLTTYPSFCYGSVPGTSDLRKGVTHYETFSIIFCFAFLMLYIVFRDILKHVPMFERKSK